MYQPRIARRRWAVAIGVLGLLTLSWGLTRDGAIGQQPQANDANQQNLEVLGHGPVHEAFAQPSVSTLEADVTINKQPPDPIEEIPPQQKPEGDNVVWIPGYWAFDQERNDFIWVSGFWRNVPPGRVWIPGYWVSVDNGFRWVAGYWQEPQTTEVRYYPAPPEPIVEVPPPQPPEASIYVPGIWIYQDTRYAWRPGYWMPYREGWVYSSPTYVWTPGGYLFVNGYWDYEFNRRGLLFAPVWFGPQYFANQRYYQPSYVIATQPLLAALFVQPRWGGYYFGDYYGPRYAQAGFVPWFDYRYGGRYMNPTFAYYNTRYRGDAAWANNLRATYAARRSGEAAVPPRRFDVANTTQVNNNVLVAPLQQVSTNLNLQAVSKQEATAAAERAQQVRSFVKTRRDAETDLRKKGQLQQPASVRLQAPGADGGTQKAVQNVPPLPKEPAANPKATPPAGKAVGKQPAGKQPDVPDRPTPDQPGKGQPKGVDSPKKDPSPKGKQPDDDRPDPKRIDPTPKASPPKDLPDPKQPKTPATPKVDRPKADPPPVDRPKATPPKIDRPDPPKVDRPDPPKVNQPKVNPPKVDRPDPPKVNRPNIDVPKATPPKQAPPNVQPTRPVQPLTPPPQRPNVERPEPRRPEPPAARPEPRANPQPPKANPRPEPAPAPRAVPAPQPKATPRAPQPQAPARPAPRVDPNERPRGPGPARKGQAKKDD